MDLKNFGNADSKEKNYILNEVRSILRCFSTVILRCFLPAEQDGNNLITKNKKAIGKGIFFFILSLMLGFSGRGFMSGPFGLSVICASYGTLTPLCFCGASVSCFFNGTKGLMSFICYFLVFLIRKSISYGKFNEKTSYRVVCATVSSTLLGLFGLISGGVNGISLISYFTYVILSVLSTYLFSIAFHPKKNKATDGVYLLSLYSVCVCLIPSLNIFSFGSVDFGVITASFFTLWFSKAKGPVYGCVSGFVFGFALSNPLCSAALGTGGLIAGYVFTKSLYVASLTFPLSTLFCYVYLMDTSTLHLFLPFTFGASLLFIALARYLPDIFSYSESYTIKEEKKISVNCENEFDRVSDSLTGLSSVICKFAEHMKAPSSVETTKIIDDAFDKVCSVCSMKNMCYAKRESDFDSVRSKIASSLISAPLKEEELSHMLLDKCIKTNLICDNINKEYSDLYFFTMKANRTKSIGSLYNSMSHLLKNTAKNQEESKSRDEKLEKSVIEALNKVSIPYTFVRVYGKRSKTISIHGIRADKIPCSSDDLCLYLSKECRLNLGNASFDISDSADMVLKFIRTPILSLEYAQCCEAKDEESVNGDTTSFFETSDDFFYTVIADGMGSGKTAAATSRLSCVFLEKMLSAGTSKNICIEMLNNLLMSKNDEAFSGIDLLEVDKLSGNACFIKAGAAPSFVLRKSRLYKINSQTPPVGIIPSFSAESTKFSLEKGDVIIMVSDGVIQSDSDAVWLSEVVSSEKYNEPALLAQKLIEKSKSIEGRKDDASACVVRIN